MSQPQVKQCYKCQHCYVTIRLYGTQWGDARSASVFCVPELRHQPLPNINKRHKL